MTTIDLGGARAARREGRATEIRVRLDEDAEACVLPVEMPVDALTPLKTVDLEKDLGLIFQAKDAESGERILRDLLTVRPRLASELLEAGKQVLERLFCSCELKPWEDDAPDTHETDCQWKRWLSWRPSPQDYRELLVGLWGAYGANLGEAFAPAGSSGTGGRTSKPTSRTSTRSSTREGSGKTPAKTGS